MKVAIIRYNAGNTRSVVFALNRLGLEPVVTDDTSVIGSADKVILPGVGAAGAAMQHLREKGLDAAIQQLKQPVLGICLGMQLLCRYSEEDDCSCLGLLDLPVRKMQGGKIPHMGWNQVRDMNGPLFNSIAEPSYLYFVHGYAVATGEYTIATTDYTSPFSAALQQDNFWGVQFHPEKSGTAGLQLLQNFITL